MVNMDRQPGDPDYDPEVDDPTRWSRCGVPHPTLEGITCRMLVFDKEPHRGVHGFLVRWED